MAKLKILKGGYPVTLTIDGEEIAAVVTRFDVDQYAAFMRGFGRTQDPHSERMVSMRLPGEEQAKHFIPRDRTAVELARIDELPKYRARLDAVAERLRSTMAADELEAALADLEAMYAAQVTYVSAPPQREVFVVSADEIRRRRLVEMTDAQRAAYERQRADDEQFSATFIREQLAAHLRIRFSQISEEDADGTERDITSGEDFARIYGGRQDILLQGFRAIYQQNTLSEAAKNVLSSRRASQRSSAASELTPTTEAPGLRPEAPALNAAPAPFATTADATAPSETSTDASTPSSQPESSGSMEVAIG